MIWTKYYRIYFFFKVFHDKSAQTDFFKKFKYIKKKHAVGGVKGGEGGKEVDLAKEWGEHRDSLSTTKQAHLDLNFSPINWILYEASRQFHGNVL